MLDLMTDQSKSRQLSPTEAHSSTPVMVGDRGHAAKPKVLFFLPGLGIGGAERHTLELRARLRDRGYRTGLVVYGRSRSEHLAHAEGAEDAVFLDLKGMSNLPGWRRTWQALKSQHADIIVAVNQTPAIVSTLLRLTRATRAKIVCIFHTTALQSNEEKRLPIFRASALMLDAIVYVGQNQKIFWQGRRLWCRQQNVIVNGIDLDHFALSEIDPDQARAVIGLSPRDYVIGLVGAFRPEKNHAHLLEALARLRCQGVPAKVVFVGDGPKRSHVEERARELEILSHVIFTGEQADIRPFVSTFDVGVLCTTVETFPMSAIELLACGAPMVITKYGGASEIVSHGYNGFLYEPGDIAELTKHLLTLSQSDVRTELKRHARPSVERFSRKKMIDAYDQLFRDITSSGVNSTS